MDYFTIQENFPNNQKLKICIAGDIIHSRVARSNNLLLEKLGHEVIFSGPKELMPSTKHQYEQFDECLKTCDVIMMLRMQNERHEIKFKHNNYLNNYGLTLEKSKLLKKNTIIMHPAPINWGVELENGIEKLPQSRIFNQMTNGVFVRMSILDFLMEAK